MKIPAPALVSRLTAAVAVTRMPGTALAGCGPGRRQQMGDYHALACGPGCRGHRSRPRQRGNLIRRGGTAATVLCAAGAFAVLGPVAAGIAATAPARHGVEIRPPLNAAPNPLATLLTVSCTGAGSCVAGGGYTDSASADQAMAVTGSHGSWRRALELRLPSDALAANPVASVSSVACTGAGSCAGVGGYQIQNGFQALLITESGGTWGRGVKARLPGNSAVIPDAVFLGVSCTRRGSCVAVGRYADNLGHADGMIATESSGRWRRAIEISPPRNAGANPEMQLESVACAGRTCVAVGGYRDASGSFEAARVAESKGRWPRATEVRLPAGALAAQDASLTAVACAGTGFCEAVGSYDDHAGSAGMAVTESGGRWRRAIGTRPPRNARANLAVDPTAISCTGAGTCVSVGRYFNKAGHGVAMRAVESAGTWARAVQVTPPANAGSGANQFSILFSVACIRSRSCVAVGDYLDTSGNSQAMATVMPVP